MYQESQFENTYNLPKRRFSTYHQTNGSQEITVLTNSFRVMISKRQPQQIYVFKIKITPYIQVQNNAKIQRLLKNIIPSISLQIPNPIFGGLNIFSFVEPTKKQQTYETEGHTITITQVRQFRNQENKTIYFQVLHNTLRTLALQLGCMQIGKSGTYFNPKPVKQINENMSVYRGMKPSFSESQIGIVLKIDTVSKNVQKTTVLQFINQIYKRKGDLQRQQKRQAVNQELKNRVVMTNYGKPRYETIESISFQKMETIIIPSQENLTLPQYYLKKYNLKPKINQPLIKVKNRNKIDTKIVYLIPQFCFMTGYPDNIDEVNRRQISNACILDPSAKFKQIKEYSEHIINSQQIKALQPLGVRIQRNVLELKGQLLKCPGICLGNTKMVQRGKQPAFNLYNNKIFDSQYEICLGIIYFSYNNADQINKLKTIINESSIGFGLKTSVHQYPVSYQKQYSKSQLRNKFQKAAEQIKSNKKQLNLFIFVFKNDMEQCYSHIKMFCLNQLKMVSQVVYEGTLRKKSYQSIIGKILLQVAVKAGNTLWAPKVPNQIADKTMLMSFDVSQAGKQKKLIGITTCNANLTKYFCESITIDQNQDKFKGMTSILLTLVNKVTKRNGRYPEEIIVLTNSCPNNQIGLYLEYFVHQAVQKLNQISNNSIRLTIIQIKDLVSDRFFVGERGLVKNPPPGLLVNNSIVSRNFDFYLVSQSSRIGCTVPIHFVVIHSNSKLDQGIIQELMYIQCFNYANWSGSIKIPAIMQYAKKLSRFSSEVLEEKNVKDQLLCSRLYYI